MRLLLLKPAGRLLRNGNVHSGIESLSQAYTNMSNIGDLFVHTATLALLDYEYIEHVAYGKCTDQYIDYVNSNFDAIVLRGSNYIHLEYDFTDILDILERTTLPVVAVGIGCQASEYMDVKIPETSMRALHLLSEKSARIGVRGHFTQEILAKMGINNTQAIGCPSIFRYNRPTIEMQVIAPELVRRVSFTPHFGLHGIYIRDNRAINNYQFSLLDYLCTRYTVDIIWQGEIVGKRFYYNFETDKADEALSYFGMPMTNGNLLEAFHRNSWFGTNADAYYRFVPTHDFSIGVRLHGNVTALASGIPSVNIVYDSRTREFAELFSIPKLDAYKGDLFDFDQFYDASTFVPFTQKYAFQYKEMADFFDANGLSHHMTP